MMYFRFFIQAAIKSDKKLAEFLCNPLIKKTLKKQAIEEGLKKNNYNPLTINMLGAMAENGRMNYANAIITAFSKIMSAERGEVLCEVTTAKVFIWHYTVIGFQGYKKYE